MTRGLWPAAIGAVVLGLGAANVSAGNAAMGQDYDNPTQNGRACVVLNKYRTKRRGGGRYQASVAVENVCGRTMEVQVCMLYREAVEDSQALCMEDRVRPFSSWNADRVMAAARLAGVQISWRQLGTN